MPTKKELIVEIGAKLDKLEAGLRKAKSKTNDFNKSLTNLGKKVVGIFALREVARFGSELSNIAGISEGVEMAFNRIADLRLMERLKKATRNTVSELELMRKVVRANQFKISLEALPRLLEFASRRAQEAGIDVDMLTEKLVLGLGRKSVLILDDLGITSSQLRDEMQGLSVDAASVAEITEAVGRIAERELGKMGGALVTSSDKTAILKSKFDNLKVALGERLNRSLDKVKEGLGGLVDNIKNFVKIPLSKKLIETRIALNAEFEVLKKSNISTEMRKNLMQDINMKYQKYLPNLIEEKTSLEDITKIQEKANKALLKKIEIQAKNEIIQEKINKVANTEKNLQKTLIATEKAKHELDVQSKNNYEGRAQAAEKYFDLQSKGERLSKRLTKAQKELTETIAQLGEVEEITSKESEILGKGKGKSLGYLGELEKKIKDLEEARKKASEKEIPALNDRIKLLKAEKNLLLDQTTLKSGLLDLGMTEESPVEFLEDIDIKPLEDLDTGLIKFNKTLELVKKTGAEVGESLRDLGSQSDSIEEYAQNAVNSAKRIISSNIALGISEAIVSALRNVPFPLNIIAGGIAGGAAAALFNSLIPSFSEGGRVTKPTLSILGDNPGKDELVVPSEKYSQVFGKRNDTRIFISDVRLRKKDIYISFKEEEKRIASIL